MKANSDISQKEAGFTLIEVLCVLFMIGLLSGAVVMSLPEKKSPVKAQAETVVNALNAIIQDGLVSGEVRGFGVSETHYALYQYDGTTFNIVEQRVWGNDIEPALSINSRAVKLPEKLSPQILFEPTGVNRPFQLSLLGSQDSYGVSSQGDGRAILTLIQ